MSASCEWSLSMTGRNRNKYLDEILTVLCEIENIDKADYDKIFQTRDGKAFRTKELTRIIYTDNSVAKNIFGENYLEPKVDFCLLIAKAVPKAKWVIESTCISESGGEGCESYMIASALLSTEVNFRSTTQRIHMSLSLILTPITWYRWKWQGGRRVLRNLKLKPNILSRAL